MSDPRELATLTARMILILTIRNAEALQDGMAAQYVVDAPSTVLGRSRNCNWNLPDPTNAISSRHCEIRRADEYYFIKDLSTNGTFLNDGAERIGAERAIAPGDLIRIGKYEILASFEEEAAPEQAAAPEETAIPDAPPEPAPENLTVMWDSLADGNKVDWARGGFGVKVEAAAPIADDAGADALVAALIEAAALGGTEVPRSAELVRKVGGLLKRLVSGLLVMVEARARAKAQMGAEMTGLQLEGNNPIKFARSPEQALAQLLMPPEPGFMDADKAVEDAFIDLQSHQVATLRAIPGSLRATLDRFSPGSIRRRADSLGILGRILPAMRDAALWRNYEREFVAVKKESDEAFMEAFSREFRKAYERQLREESEIK
ncbi:MAG TPA: type VI secretion system-associated FHA domain protein TagH [Allosphingosinicella sp.]|nr:type VI secretion system-associated FHA domain protein TagH [Allosphingosinicella sp.]